MHLLSVTHKSLSKLLHHTFTLQSHVQSSQWRPLPSYTIRCPILKKFLTRKSKRSLQTLWILLPDNLTTITHKDNSANASTENSLLVVQNNKGPLSVRPLPIQILILWRRTMSNQWPKCGAKYYYAIFSSNSNSSSTCTAALWVHHQKNSKESLS